MTVVLQVAGRAVYYCYRSWDPESPVQRAPGQVAGHVAASASEASDTALHRAAVGAMATGAGADTEYVAPPPTHAEPPAGGAARAHHRGTSITVAGLEWVLFRCPVGGVLRH